MADSYWKLLKHPEWQRKRLEKLNESNWQCDDCGDKNTTLHVHHRQYFKGRSPWDYEPDQLTVLCEPCHEAHHGDLEDIKDVTSRVYTPTLAALIAGFHCNSDWLDPGMLYGMSEGDHHAHCAGILARIFMGLPGEKALKALEFVQFLHQESSEAWHIAESHKEIFERLG